MKEIIVLVVCDIFIVMFKYIGQLDKKFMGYNWVLLIIVDVQVIVGVVLKVGVDNNYLLFGDKIIIVVIKIIGGGEQDSVIFDMSKLLSVEDYMFFCSFLGYFVIMKGSFIVKG